MTKPKKTKEIWRPTQFVHYDISSLGRIRRQFKDHYNYLSPCMFRDGYKYVTLTICGKSRSIAIHRLVATAFIDNANDKPQVNHKNGNKLDNRVDNLEWCTRSENLLHAYKNRLAKPPREKKVLCITTGQAFKSIHEASRKTDAYVANISACCRGRLKSTHNLQWRFLDEA